MGNKAKFLEYHKNNPHVFVLFKKFANQAKSAGFANYSAWAIVQRIRWHTTIEVKSKKFKISNNYIGWYSRYLVYKCPEFKGFFRHKPIRE